MYFLEVLVIRDIPNNIEGAGTKISLIGGKIRQILTS